MLFISPRLPVLRVFQCFNDAGNDRCFVAIQAAFLPCVHRMRGCQFPDTFARKAQNA